MEPKPGDYVLIKDDTDPYWNSRNTGGIYLYLEDGDYYPQLLLISPIVDSRVNGLYSSYRRNAISIEKHDLEKI